MYTELEKICVSPQLAIKHAVQILNDGHQKIVLVVDDSRRLLGVVTDSDVRRSILSGLSFEQSVSRIMVCNPIVAMEDMSNLAVLSLMQSTKCHEIPVLNKQGIVTGLHTIDRLVSEGYPTEAVVMAGGLGTRLMPITENLPKPLVQVGGKPILFTLLDQLIESGFSKIYISLNYKSEMIKQQVSAVPAYARLVYFLEEKDRLGTAGSLSLLPTPPKVPFFVVNADLLTRMDFKSMLRFHRIEGNALTMAVREQKYQIPFGVVKMDSQQVVGIEEKPFQTYFVNAGIYVIDPDLLSLITAGHYFDMPDLINLAVSTHKQVGAFPVHEYWMDVGSHSELNRARADAASIFSSNDIKDIANGDKS